ncbi:MAG: peptidoglycan-binding domain-containing protein [Candidatus Adlerbacteria bacterium]|nr:peptidoglycan-binding domain-containing protein [Candidatus Adlerbacteria bacterium]
MTITQSSTRLAALTLGVAAIVAAMFGTALATPAHAASVCPNVWTKALSVGVTNSEVMKLQQFLNMTSSTMVSSTGAGSPGLESMYFGAKTKAAVMKFQAANGIDQLGNVGPVTRAKLNSLCAGTTPTPTPTPTPGTNGTATVSAAAQPANGIAPNNAARIPFTRFTVTASGGDVTLNNVTVQRDGIAQDAAFSGVMLLDQNGNQIGISKTLNSNHQAVVGAPVVIPNGTSMTFTVAANRGTTSGYAGQVASFSVVAVNTSAAVNSGSLPISGAADTINETTTLIGTVTGSRGTNDPGSANTENVGQTAYVFSSIRLTAGSQEDTYVKSIRFHQTGSVSQSYLSNVVVTVDGVSYPTTVSTDNYYTAQFPGTGLLMQKGFSKDVAIQGDIANGSATTVVFDIQKAADINVVGAQYGYGILPSFGSGTNATNACVAAGTYCGAVKSSDDPYYAGFTATISAGIITVSTSNAVTSGNVAINQQNQIFGGFSVQDQGEPVTVGRMIFQITAGSSAATYADITSVSLVNQNGAVLAGPVDATTGGTTADALVTFTDTVTIPVGTTQLFLKGKLGTNFVTNDTIQASTTPSTQWTTVTGQTTGRSLTISPASSLTSASQTVKAAALNVTVSSVPIAQTVIAGSNQFTFANIILDATASGEDLRLTTLPVEYTWSGSANDLTNCQLYSGSTSVSDQHVFNPSSATVPASGTDTSFSLNSGGIVVPKGTTVTLALNCDVRSGVTGTYKFGFLGTETAGASGVTSGSTVNGTFTANAGNLMTASSGGTMTVALDSSTPSFGIVSAGSTGVDLGHIRFSGTNEAIDLRQVALKLSSGTRTDLVNNQVTLWDQTTNTQVGTAVFPSGTNATSSQIASGAFRIPVNGSRVLVIKGDIAAISTNGPLTASGDTIKVNYDGSNVSGTNGTYGVGVASGQNRQPSSATTAVNGATIYKSFPTFTYSTTGAVAGSGTQTLLILTVGADSKGDVTLNKLTFTINTSTASITSPTFTGPNGNVASTTLATTTAGNNLVVYFDSSSNTSDAVVAAGTTKTYNLRANVTLTGTNTTGSVSTFLKADTSLPLIVSNGNGLATTTAGTLQASNIIWSPESTSTVLTPTTNNDWTNGYGLGGCFASSGLGQDCFSNTISK